jgi:hypothetical protein
MKHVVILAALVAAIAWLVLQPSALDQLSKPPTAAALARMTAPAGNQFVTVDRVLMPVTPSYFAVPHRITVVVFHDDTCPNCGELDRNLEDFGRLRPDVAIRKIHITLNGDAYYQAIRDYRWNIYLMPCVLIYDRDGKLVAADEKTNADGGDMLTRWMNREADRAAR